MEFYKRILIWMDYWMVRKFLSIKVIHSIQIPIMMDYWMVMMLDP